MAAPLLKASAEITAAEARSVRRFFSSQVAMASETSFIWWQEHSRDLYRRSSLGACHLPKTLSLRARVLADRPEDVPALEGDLLPCRAEVRRSRVSPFFLLLSPSFPPMR